MEIQKQIVDVSIVSANYNNGKYLTQFLNSILNSTVLPKEIVIIDDASKDDSVEIIRSYNNSLIKLICFNTNKGFANALNEGIINACGKYIMRLDPDDYINSKRIELQYSFLENNPAYDIIGSNAMYFNSADNSNCFSTNFPSSPEKIKMRYQKGLHGILHGTLMIKKDVIKKYRYNQDLVPAEDYDVFARIIKDGHVGFNMLESLTFVRIHKNSVSNNLKFKTIKNTFLINSELFNRKNYTLFVYIYYLHMKLYRKFLFSSSFLRYFYLIISVLLMPSKILNRIKVFNKQ